MAILIDGYNLLNAARVEGCGRGTPLAQARRGLLDFLEQALSESEAAVTTIVFDAGAAPPGLPREEHFGAIRVLFAKGYQDADELIEELIEADHSPRQLVVVSSDHRLHRAARRRRASAIDSDAWLRELAGRRAAQTHSSAADTSPEKEGIDEKLLRAAREIFPPEFFAESARPAEPDALNPFPPGYGADVEDDGA